MPVTGAEVGTDVPYENPRFVRAAAAVDAFVPPLVIGRAPEVILDAEWLWEESAFPAIPSSTYFLVATCISALGAAAMENCTTEGGVVSAW